MGLPRTDWHHLVPDALVQRTRTPAPTMRCQCCGVQYPRGRFTCCAPPNGMASHVWLALDCPDPPDGCGKCAHHCACPTKAARLSQGPFARVGLAFLSSWGLEEAGVTEIADARSPGSEGFEDRRDRA